MTFETGDDGRVTAMVWHQGGRESSYRRIPEGSAATMTVDRLLELIGAEEQHAALLAAGGFRITGKLRMPNAGIEGRIEQLFEGEHHFRLEQDFSPFGKLMTALHESGGWNESSTQPFETLEGAELKQARNQHPAEWLTDLGEHYDEVLITQSTLEEAPAWRVRLIRSGERPTILMFDSETGLLLRREFQAKAAAGVYLPIDIRFDDYHDVAGVQIPHRIRSQLGASGEIVLEIEKAEAGVTLDPSLFLPPPGRGK